MTKWRVGAMCGCFISGVLVQSITAQSTKVTFTSDLFRGKAANEAATRLLDGALQLAELENGIRRGQPSSGPGARPGR